MSLFICNLGASCCCKGQKNCSTYSRSANTEKAHPIQWNILMHMWIRNQSLLLCLWQLETEMYSWDSIGHIGWHFCFLCFPFDFLFFMEQRKSAMTPHMPAIMETVSMRHCSVTIRMTVVMAPMSSTALLMSAWTANWVAAPSSVKTWK